MTPSRRILSRWAAADPRPLVLLIDEIDALVGDTLVSVLRHLRAGYVHRPGRFPQSIHPVRCPRRARLSHPRQRREDGGHRRQRPFNIKSESLRLGDFSAAAAQALLSQHTDETGQAWTEAARAEIWRLSQGQPWLVNALAYRACEANRDFEQAIDVDAIHEVREQLILRRETHLDQLTDKLQEERVRRVIEPLLNGSLEAPARSPPTICNTSATSAWCGPANPITNRQSDLPGSDPARPHLGPPRRVSITNRPGTSRTAT